MISKKQLLENQDVMYDILCGLRDRVQELDDDVAKLRVMVKALKCAQCKCAKPVKKPVTKIKVKGTPGRPKKIEVKVKRGPGRPRKNVQPRTKDGKFAKKK